MAAEETTPQTIIEVNEQTFQQEVIERSQEVPVVVDFWAPWCAPCRMLGPILESLAREYNGQFILAKVNVDENPQLAAQFGVQGIPAVKAFRGGRLVGEFVGAQPQPVVRQFIEQLLPDEIELKVASGRALLHKEDPIAAEEEFREVLAKNPDHPAALLGLGQALLQQGREEEGLKVLERVPPTTREGRIAARTRHALKLQREVGDTDEASLRARLAEAPNDLEARYKLASLLTIQGRYEEALEHYLEIIKRDRQFRDDGARQAMLYIFDILGDHPLAREYRNKLASVLFA
ncbi:MAG TPA: thioredoxin [Caldilineae bacterium]|nr:thioredoxin [Caldilineae bacterium]